MAGSCRGPLVQLTLSLLISPLYSAARQQLSSGCLIISDEEKLTSPFNKPLNCWSVLIMEAFISTFQQFSLLTEISTCLSQGIRPFTIRPKPPQLQRLAGQWPAQLVTAFPSLPCSQLQPVIKSLLIDNQQKCYFQVWALQTSNTHFSSFSSSSLRLERADSLEEGKILRDDRTMSKEPGSLNGRHPELFYSDHLLHSLQDSFIRERKKLLYSSNHCIFLALTLNEP